MNIFTLPQSAGGVLLGVAILLTAGFLMTRLTRRLHLPNVTGYILAGILVGPYALNLIPAWLSGGMEFVTDLALSYIAFSAGRYFRIADLKRSGGKVLAVTLAEALCAAVAVTLTMIFVFRLSVPFALLLGAIGCATAPASTIMTIRQYRAKGPFVNLLLQVTALDDAVALTAFSVCTAVVNALVVHIQQPDRGAAPVVTWGGGAGAGAGRAAALACRAGASPGTHTGTRQRGAFVFERAVLDTGHFTVAGLYGTGRGLCEPGRRKASVQADGQILSAVPAAVLRAFRPASQHPVPRNGGRYRRGLFLRTHRRQYKPVAAGAVPRRPVHHQISGPRSHASGRRFHRSCRAGPTHAACGRRHDAGYHHPFLRCTAASDRPALRSFQRQQRRHPPPCNPAARAGMGGCRACRIRATRRNRLARRDKTPRHRKKTQKPLCHTLPFIV